MYHKNLAICSWYHDNNNTKIWIPIGYTSIMTYPKLKISSMKAILGLES